MHRWQKALLPIGKVSHFRGLGFFLATIKNKAVQVFLPGKTKRKVKLLTAFNQNPEILKSLPVWKTAWTIDNLNTALKQTTRVTENSDSAADFEPDGPLNISCHNFEYTAGVFSLHSFHFSNFLSVIYINTKIFAALCSHNLRGGKSRLRLWTLLAKTSKRRRFLQVTVVFFPPCAQT